jgi:cell wall assembly regulator SMI1
VVVHTAGPWERIEVWLDRYAPSYRATLNDGASEDRLAAVERAMGVPLPEDLRAWWLRANGVRPGGRHASGSLIPERYHPCSAETALATRDMQLDSQRDVYPAPLRAQLDRFVDEQTAQPAGTLPRHSGLLWLPLWLPVAEDQMGGGLFTDLRGGPQHGCVLVYANDGAPAGPVWPDVSAMWMEVADALESVDHEAFERTNEHVAGRWHVPYH